MLLKKFLVIAVFVSIGKMKIKAFQKLHNMLMKKPVSIGGTPGLEKQERKKSPCELIYEFHFL